MKSSVSLRDIVFGFNDGSVSALALLSGVVGGALTKNSAIIAGISAVVSGAISMALGAYISSKSEREQELAEIEAERREVHRDPRGEQEKLREILAEKTPLSDVELGSFVDAVAADEEAVLDMLVTEELGLSDTSDSSPYHEGFIMGTAHLAGGLVPLLPFILVPGVRLALAASVLVTFGSLFGVGAWKASFTLRHWASSGAEMVLVGLLATVIPFLVGDILINRLLQNYVG